MKSRRGRGRGKVLKYRKVGESLLTREQVELGQRIYPMVLSSIRCSNSFAGKVTGMILELEREVITEIITSPKVFQSALEQAVSQLDSAGKIVWKGEGNSFACLCTEGSSSNS
jgi:hypothetical protein